MIILNIVLWVVQIALAMKFVSVSYSHGLRQSQSEMQQAIKRMGEYSQNLLYVIAVLTFFGGVGLVLPAAFGVLTWITPATALMLTVMMLAGIMFHMLCRDNPKIWAGVIVCFLAAFVAFGRWVLVPL